VAVADKLIGVFVFVCLPYLMRHIPPIASVLIVLDLVGLDSETCDLIKKVIAAIKLKGLAKALAPIT
jgi:hypothetical protein